MTPVPCNFSSTANCDYRVGVELLAMHHLSQLLLSFFSLAFFPLFRHAVVSIAVPLKQCFTPSGILNSAGCPFLMPRLAAREKKTAGGASLKCTQLF